MAYIGTSPSNGVRRVHTYTATASQTTFSGASSEGVTLSYADTNYLDVYQNGILLGSADYTATSGTSVVLAQAASASDLVVIVVYDVFSVADTVSKANGGTFDADVTMANNLLVGTTNSSVESSSTDEGVNILPNKIGVARDGGVTANFNRLTSDGDIIKFRKDGTAIGSIGVTGTDILYVANPDGSAVGFNFDGDNPKINPCDGTGSGTDGVADLGHSGGRYKDLYLSGGVYLGGTGSANYLTDYESGSFTATLFGSTSGSGTNVTTTSNYTKVGSLVTVGGYFQNVNLSSMSGSAQIGGLPFNPTGNYFTGSVGLYGFTFSGYVSMFVNVGTTTADLLDIISGGAWAGLAIPAAAGKYLRFTITYRSA